MKGGTILKLCAVIASLAVMVPAIAVSFLPNDLGGQPKGVTVLSTTEVVEDSDYPTGTSPTVQISPGVMNRNARSSGNIVVKVNPANLWGTPRDNILVAWWCWAIDPRPPECEIFSCDPIPGDLPDPFCPKEMKAIELEDGSEGIMLKFNRSPLMKRAGDLCGEVSVSLIAGLADGSIIEGKAGTVDLKDPKSC